MRLHIIARGKIGRSPEAELVDRYAKRIAWPFRLTELPDTGGTLPAPLHPYPMPGSEHDGRVRDDDEGNAAFEAYGVDVRH